MNLNKRDQKEILEYLKHITSELTDAYNSTPDTSENSDALYFIDSARDLVDELTINVEDNQEVPVPHEDFMTILNVAQAESERRFEDSKEAN